jgi:hypothetical protein
MREPWEVFASVLTGALGVVLLVSIFLVGTDIAAVTRADGGKVELERWQSGIREADIVAPGAANGGDASRGGEVTDRTSPLVAMVLFACIPIVTYAVGLVSFVRRRRWPYVIMTAMQVALLLAVAFPALFAMFG